MKKSYIRSFLFLLLFSVFCNAQNLVQNVRGTVTDKESGFPLAGVLVRMSGDSSGKLASATDMNGNFKISDVPVGRRSFTFSFTGYKTWVASDIIVVSGKESILTVDMEEEAMTLEEVKVVAEDKGSFNDMSSVSTKLFSIEETERYPGLSLIHI